VFKNSLHGRFCDDLLDEDRFHGVTVTVAANSKLESAIMIVQSVPPDLICSLSPHTE